MEFEVEGARLNVEADGPSGAPALLLWHGAACTLRMWDRVVERLKDRYFSIRFDVRGVGLSSPTADPDTQYTFERYADDANRILDAYGVEKCHVWSMAWGTRAALAYCSLHPERVVSAAFYDASIGRADVAAQRAGGKEALKRQIEAGVEPFERPEGWSFHKHPDSVPAALGAAAKFDLAAVVPKLSMPLLVATGDCDPNLSSSRDLVDRAADARLVVFENVGHGSILQRPDLTTSAFLEFQASLAR
ncbi:MAG: alpha/beta fold hydrolase [Proteobacteria bacterium]|nr:alpha/beta fold hydrolase [Pseudomonadota bacterium]